MARSRVIVGIGEALMSEQPDSQCPAGLALEIPILAVGLGHTGIAISRLGQDRTAEELRKQLRQLGVDVSCLQSDPDLATGRLLTRSSGSRRSLDAPLAFDNLQWDFDLADVAQRADAVVIGALARRSGQARSTCDRFLAECSIAFRIFDLTNRGGEELDRQRVMAALKGSEAAVVDEAALAQLFPETVGGPQKDAVGLLLRQANLTLALFAAEGQPLGIYFGQQSQHTTHTHRRQAHEATIVGLLHGILAGSEMPDALALAEQLAIHSLENPGQPPPERFLVKGP